MKKQKLTELELKPIEADIIKTLHKPRAIAEIAVEANCGYSTASQYLSIMAAKKWVIKIKTSAGRTVYQLNTQTIEV